MLYNVGLVQNFFRTTHKRLTPSPDDFRILGAAVTTGVRCAIRHGGDRAYYTRAGDYIQLPKQEQFHDAPAYYATGCHELIHWTGNEKRLNRETLTKSRGISAADDHYAREELVAELGSWLLSLETGIPHDPSQHTAYIASWLEALKKDKNEIFRAASAAAKATDYVLNREQEKAAEPGPHTERISAEAEQRQTRYR